jgi:paraquat-inducible protein B
MIGAEPSLTDLSSLTAVLSGVSIGAAPGTGAPQRHFVGMDAPPPVPPDETGSYYYLYGADLGAKRVGSGIYYRGFEVGRVERVMLDPSLGFQLTAFVRTPYDRLVKPDTLFFNTQALEVSLSSTGVGARLGPGNSALAGGVEFETAPEVKAEPQSPSGATFQLYADAASAALGRVGPEVVYQTTLHEGGTLKPGALVSLEGFPVGRVLNRALALDPDHGLAATTVRLAIAPERLGLQDRVVNGSARSPLDWRRSTDVVLERLVRSGYRLRPDQSPPLLGPAALAFQKMDAPPPASGRVADGWLPAAAAPSVSDVIGRADSLLRQAQAIPLAEIGQNLRQLVGRLNSLAGSPQVAESLVHLQATLANLDRITSDVAPKAGPLAAKLLDAAQDLDQAAAAASRALGGAGAAQDGNLTDTLRQVTAAARALRTLADDLDRHPEAALKGKPASR